MDEGGGSDGIRDGIVIDRCLMCLPAAICIRRSPLSLVISDIKRPFRYDPVALGASINTTYILALNQVIRSDSVEVA